MIFSYSYVPFLQVTPNGLIHMFSIVFLLLVDSYYHVVKVL